MEKLAFILLCGVVLFSPISADDCESSEFNNENFEVREESGKLVFVNETIRSDDSPAEKVLIIENNNITSIAPNTFNNLTISELHIYTAPGILNVEPESFNGLPNLDHLFIFSGAVPMKKELFREVKSLNNLMMEVHQSQGTIKDVLSDLQNLTSLSIFKSDLKRIDADTFYDTSSPLSFLVLINNTFDSIVPNAFASMKNLKGLVIYHTNGFKNLQPGTFNGLDQLTMMSLQWNNFTVIPRNCFNGLRKLEKLELYDEHVEKIEAGAFDGLSVRILELSINKDVEIADDAFKNSQIGMLKLSDDFEMPVNRSAWGLPESTVIVEIDYFE